IAGRHADTGLSQKKVRGDVGVILEPAVGGQVARRLRQPRHNRFFRLVGARVDGEITAREFAEVFQQGTPFSFGIVLRLNQAERCNRSVELQAAVGARPQSEVPRALGSGTVPATAPLGPVKRSGPCCSTASAAVKGVAVAVIGNGTLLSPISQTLPSTRTITMP